MSNVRVLHPERTESDNRHLYQITVEWGGNYSQTFLQPFPETLDGIPLTPRYVADIVHEGINVIAERIEDE